MKGKREGEGEDKGGWRRVLVVVKERSGRW